MPPRSYVYTIFELLRRCVARHVSRQHTCALRRRDAARHAMRAADTALKEALRAMLMRVRQKHVYWRQRRLMFRHCCCATPPLPSRRCLRLLELRRDMPPSAMLMLAARCYATAHERR